jgi:hypothetical protein
MRAVAPAISILVSARASKIPLYISEHGDLPAPLETAEQGAWPDTALRSGSYNNAA